MEMATTATTATFPSPAAMAFRQTGAVWSIGFVIWLVAFLICLALVQLHAGSALGPILSAAPVLEFVIAFAIALIHLHTFVLLLRDHDRDLAPGSLTLLWALWAIGIAALAAIGGLNGVGLLFIDETVSLGLPQAAETGIGGGLLGRFVAAPIFWLLPLVAAILFVPLVGLYRAVARDPGPMTASPVVLGAIVTLVALLIAQIAMHLAPYAVIPLAVLLNAIETSPALSAWVLMIAVQLLKILALSLGLAVGSAYLARSVAGEAVVAPATQADRDRRRAREAEPLAPHTREAEPVVIDWSDPRDRDPPRRPAFNGDRPRTWWTE